MTQYTAMCQAFATKIKFKQKSPVGSPQGSPFDAEQLAAVAQAAMPSMPRAYMDTYGLRLIEALPMVTQLLEAQQNDAIQQGQDPDQVMAETQSLIDTLVGAIRDWKEQVYQAPLKRFEAVISI